MLHSHKVQNMKLLKYKKFAGLHIVCKSCNKTIEVNPAPYNGCNHPIEKQRYKGLFRKNGKRTTKDLKSTNYDDAVAELIEWKKNLDNPPIKLIEAKKEKQTDLFKDWIWIYSDWLENIGVPEHEQRRRSINYIKDRIRYILKFKTFIEKERLNTNTLKINQIDSKLFGKYYKYVGDMTTSPAGFNHSIRAIKGFFKFIVEEKEFPMFNPAKKAKLKYENPNPISISDNDFIKLLSAITENDSIEINSKGKKRNRYRPWIKDAIELAAYTGMRLEEVATLKYSDIKLDAEGNLDYLEGTDLKYEKAHNWDKSKPKKIVPIPITPELESLLTCLDYKNNLGADKYLIDSNCTFNRKSLAKELSHAFTFFRRKAGLPNNFSIKHLRKTFLTKLETQTGLVASAGYQKNISVIRKNYIDRTVVSREIKNRGFSFFNKTQSILKPV